MSGLVNLDPILCTDTTAKRTPCTSNRLGHGTTCQPLRWCSATPQTQRFASGKHSSLTLVSLSSAPKKKSPFEGCRAKHTPSHDLVAQALTHGREAASNARREKAREERREGREEGARLVQAKLRKAQRGTRVISSRVRLQ